MTLKEYVIATIKPDEYYSKRFLKWSPTTRSLVSCPFHTDGARPNLSVGLRNGGARCHSSSCQKRLGNVVHFEAELQGIRESIAARRLYREFIRKVVPQKTIAAFREHLAVNSNYILQIRKEMGLRYPSLRRHSIGLCPDSNRVAIPVHDRFGQIVNIRFYRLPSERTDADEAKLYNLTGYGTVDLFGYPWIDDIPAGVPLYIMASEKEQMLAEQDGLYAVSATTGEGSWDDAWNYLLKDRDTFIVYDVDKGGQDATTRLFSRLQETGNRIHKVLLPFRIKRKDYKDYADWRLKEHHNVSELKRIAKHKAKSSRRQRYLDRDRVSDLPTITTGDHSDNGIEFPKLPKFASKELLDIAAISSCPDLLNKRIRTQGIVSAKSPNTYTIPWKFKVKIKGRPDFNYELPIGRHMLMFVRSNDTTILQSLQSLIGDSKAEIKPLAYLTAVEVEIIPTAVADKDIPYVTQRCYYFGNRIDANVPYYLEIIPTSEIRSQETIGIITSRSPVSKSIERFDFTPENLADLSFFQPEGESVWDKLESVATHVADNYTRVYNRMDWTLAAMLTWTSPIGWFFPNEPELQRGWLNTLALGDTETGKSKVAKGLQKLFNCGVFVSGENCTFVGLIGGAIKAGSDKLMLRWGRIPLSDKQLVILEELSGLTVDEISNMSDVRSSGFARLDKGGINTETNSRTRLLCLSNARSTRHNLSSYVFGVRAVQDLIGHGEDIARFDLITTLTDREVPIELINSDRFATVAKRREGGNINIIASDMFQKLIHFIWALTPEQVKFSQEAYEECLNQTKRLASLYHPAIPIFKGGSGRYKLGRIAASIACLQFAWDEGAIRITEEHVQAAARLLEFIYNKPSLGYYEYSQQMYERETVKEATLVRKVFKSAVPSASTLPKVIKALVHGTRFTRDELCALCSTNNLHADRLIGYMYRANVVDKVPNTNVWEITPAGKKFFDKFYQKLI